MNANQMREDFQAIRRIMRASPEHMEEANAHNGRKNVAQENPKAWDYYQKFLNITCGAIDTLANKTPGAIAVRCEGRHWLRELQA